MTPSRLLLLALAILASLAIQVCARSSTHHPHPSSLSWLDRTFSTGSIPLRPSHASVLDQPSIDLSGSRSEAFVQLRRNLIRRAEIEARTILGGGDPTRYVHPPVKNDQYPYWGFIPAYLGGATPDGVPLSWNATASSCFQENSAVLVPQTASGSFTLSLTVGAPSSFLCSDFYLFATIDGLILHTFSSAGTFNFTWSLSAPTAALEFDLTEKGVRVFRFRAGLIELLGNVIDTAMLFEAEAMQGVPEDAALRNIDFLTKYAGFTMTPRNVTEVILDESEIESGDFFGLVRLDGLDPMLAWAMGSTTGHTTVALWIGSQLYVCESTAKGAHWPVNGIQKTPYRTWLQQVKAAGQQAVHAPLTPEARALFNESAALEWFLEHEGLGHWRACIECTWMVCWLLLLVLTRRVARVLIWCVRVDYGYHTLLWGWLDTVADNYPVSLAAHVSLLPASRHC
jgi:hypothetical protein